MAECTPPADSRKVVWLALVAQADFLRMPRPILTHRRMRLCSGSRAPALGDHGPRWYDAGRGPRGDSAVRDVHPHAWYRDDLGPGPVLCCPNRGEPTEDPRRHPERSTIPAPRAGVPCHPPLPLLSDPGVSVSLFPSLRQAFSEGLVTSAASRSGARSRPSSSISARSGVRIGSSRSWRPRHPHFVRNRGDDPPVQMPHIHQRVSPSGGCAP